MTTRGTSHQLTRCNDACGALLGPGATPPRERADQSISSCRGTTMDLDDGSAQDVYEDGVYQSPHRVRAVIDERRARWFLKRVYVCEFHRRHRMLMSCTSFPLELLLCIIYYSDWRTLGAWRRTSHACFSMVATELRHRYEEYLAPFVGELRAFDCLLRSHGAVISGALALHFFVPDSAWSPRDLDVYLPANTYHSFVRSVTAASPFAWIRIPAVRKRCHAKSSRRDIYSFTGATPRFLMELLEPLLPFADLEEVVFRLEDYLPLRDEELSRVLPTRGPICTPPCSSNPTPHCRTRADSPAQLS